MTASSRRHWRLRFRCEEHGRTRQRVQSPLVATFVLVTHGDPEQASMQTRQLRRSGNDKRKGPGVNRRM
eukprot:352587-Chlamydomonas_euryale.AAC.10